jgi:hypothetical protein
MPAALAISGALSSPRWSSRSNRPSPRSSPVRLGRAAMKTALGWIAARQARYSTIRRSREHLSARRRCPRYDRDLCQAAPASSGRGRANCRPGSPIASGFPTSRATSVSPARNYLTRERHVGATSYNSLPQSPRPASCICGVKKVRRHNLLKFLKDKHAFPSAFTPSPRPAGAVSSPSERELYPCQQLHPQELPTSSETLPRSGFADRSRRLFCARNFPRASSRFSTARSSTRAIAFVLP